jgi:hypothetical protein
MSSLPVMELLVGRAWLVRCDVESVVAPSPLPDSCDEL